MVASDLHLEKKPRFSLKPGSLQDLETTETLARLQQCAALLKPKKIILLGDIFHDAQSFDRMSLDNIDRLYRFIKSHDIVWIEGNHYGGFSPPNVDMRIEYAFLNINFRHVATDNEDYEISGHYHPSVTINHKNERIRRRCFVCDKTKLIAPSFGSHNQGLDVSDPALRTLFGEKIKVYPLAPHKVYGLSAERFAR